MPVSWRRGRALSWVQKSTQARFQLKVKGFWFKTRGKQLLTQMYPHASFFSSDSWFDGFKTKHGISMRRQTHVAQKPPSNKKKLSSTSIIRLERLPRSQDQHDPLDAFCHHKLQTWTKCHCPSVSWMEKLMQILVTRLCGCETVLLVLKKGNAQPR